MYIFVFKYTPDAKPFNNIIIRFTRLFFFVYGFFRACLLSCRVYGAEMTSISVRRVHLTSHLVYTYHRVGLARTGDRIMLLFRISSPLYSPSSVLTRALFSLFFRIYTIFPPHQYCTPAAYIYRIARPMRFFVCTPLL